MVFCNTWVGFYPPKLDSLFVCLFSFDNKHSGFPLGKCLLLLSTHGQVRLTIVFLVLGWWSQAIPIFCAEPWNWCEWDAFWSYEDGELMRLRGHFKERDDPKKPTWEERDQLSVVKLLLPAVTWNRKSYWTCQLWDAVNLLIWFKPGAVWGFHFLDDGKSTDRLG